MKKQELVNAISERTEAMRKNCLDQIAAMPKLQRRQEALAGFIMTIPKKVLNRSEIVINGNGNWVDATLRSKFGKFTEHDTMLITAWCGSLKDAYRFTKDVDYAGGWIHNIHRTAGGWRDRMYYDVTFQGTSDIDGCELEEVIETREVKCFKVKC